MGLPNNSPKVVDKDKGYKRLVEEVFKFSNPVLSVGILTNEAGQTYKDSDATVLDVATWNEFGTETIPSRPFIRGWYDATLPEIKKKLAGLLKMVIKGKLSKEQALEQLGAWMVGSIQARIARSGDGTYPPNADSTIARKGSSVPLIDTGILRSSITYKVSER